MDKRTLEMLKELTEAHGVPGFESDVRAVIRKHVAGLATIEHDRLGSIVCRKQGAKPSPRVIIPGHMDEIGFMVKVITSEGYIRFAPLGGWFDQVVLSQRVIIKGSKGDVPGLIGSKPPHLLSADERKKVVEKKDMFIDIGATTKDQVEKEYGVRVGDPIVPVSPFGHLKNQKLLVAKAWDDRVGCGLFIDVIRQLQKERHPNTVYGVGTVQEEVGTRGAQTAAEVVKPDVCLVVESGIAGDTPGIKPEEAQGKLGGGPILYVLDAGMIGHRKLRDLVIQVAEKKKIPFQLSALEGGATNGRPIHLHSRGVPSIFLGVPARYIHSHAGIIHADDYDHTVKLLVEVVKKLDQRTVEDLVA